MTEKTHTNSSVQSMVKSLDVEFEGVVPTDVRSEIVKELVKYILYERGQIPMYYDQVKDCCSSEEKRQMHNGEKGSHRAPISYSRDRQLFMKDADSLFDTITNVFTNIVPVKGVLLILGSSIMNPRDSYLISFPTEFYEGAMLTHQVCVQKVFRQLITSDFVGNAKPLSSCTSLYVLFLAQRNCKHQIASLLPKLSFKVPSRGSRYSINFSFTSAVMKSSDFSFSENEVVEISGIEALESSLDEEEMSTSTIQNSDSAPDSYLTGGTDESCTSYLEDAGITVSDDYIWYQAPTVVKGFKEKVADGAKFWKLP